MPKTKLTLTVDPALVERARRFSRRNDTSISKLVSAFLASLGDDEGVSTPIVSRLRGVLPSSASREQYRAHLEAKYR